MSAAKFVAVPFEVFGRVQGVFFRKYTEKQAKKLELVGWVANTKQGTVKGEMQGNVNNVHQMKNWLSEVGSPSSKIDHAEFGQETPLDQVKYEEFSVRKTF